VFSENDSYENKVELEVLAPEHRNRDNKTDSLEKNMKSADAQPHI